MRRVAVYPGAIPQEQDVLNGQKNTMISIGHVLQDMLGTSTLFSGLGCVPTGPAGMTVNVNPGRAYSLQATDTGAYSSLAADARSLVKQGILLDLVNFACPAPTTAGFSINYLIQGAFQEIDAGSVVLPYYNAANPAVAFSGPNGTGTSNTTFRDNTVQLQLKPGAAATTGSQVTPTPDAGFNGLWVVTVAFGQVTITSTSITQYTGAPFLSAPLLQQIQQAPSVVGQARNVAMPVAAASATATLTADEIVVKTALGLQSFVLSSFSKTINLATTGAGGMDTGVAPTSGFVALYAIYNPTTQTSALLATNAATLQANVYGGANMPAGYTASALISVWPTNASKLFITGNQIDRSIYIPSASALSTSATQATPLALSIASIVPANAKNVSGVLGCVAGASPTTLALQFFASSLTTQIGFQDCAATLAASTGIFTNLRNLPMPTLQTVYYVSSNTSGTSGFSLSVSQYDI